MNGVGHFVARCPGLYRSVLHLLQDDLVLPRIPGVEVAEPSMPTVRGSDDLQDRYLGPELMSHI